MNPAIDFQFVSKPKRQELCTNPLYYAYAEGETLKLILIEDELAKKISISKHTPDYILIKINSNDINVLPSHPRLLERHIRIDRVFAQKGDNRAILSKLHFTWIFANAAGEKVEFRGYYHKNSFDCLQTKGKSKAFVTDQALLNTIYEQAKTEYSLFLQINAKCATEYHKAQSRYEAKVDAMSESQYLATVTDAEFAADMEICKNHFLNFKNLSEENINNVFEIFKTHIHLQLNAQRNSTASDENSFEEAQEEKAAPAKAKASKKKNKNKAKTDQHEAYDVNLLKDKFKVIMAKAHEIKEDPALSLHDFLTYVIQANAEKRDWEREATPVWCALDDTSTDLKRLEIMRDMLDEIPSKIRVATESVDDDEGETTIDPQKATILFPPREDFFENLFDEFLQEEYFRPIKNEADFAKRFGITADAVIKDRKLKHFSRAQIISEHVFDVQKIHEEEFSKLMILFSKLYLKQYKTFITDLKAMLLSHKNLDTPNKKNSYQILMNLANSGRPLVLQDLLTSCLLIDKFADTFKILSSIQEIRKKIKKDNLAACFCLGEAHALCLQNLNSASPLALSEEVFNAYYEMWSAMEEHLKTTTPSLSDQYIGTALSFSLYQSMKGAKDKLFQQSSSSKDTASPAELPPESPAKLLTYAYQATAVTPKNDSPEHLAVQALLALKVSGSDENQTSPNRKLNFS